MRTSAEVWFVVALLAVDLAGVGWYTGSLPITSRQKTRIWIGLAAAAALTALASLAKGYSPAMGAMLYGDVVAGALVVLVLTRGQMIQGFRAEVDGVKAELARRPIYVGLVCFFAVFAALSVAEYVIFR